MVVCGLSIGKLGMWNWCIAATVCRSRHCFMFMEGYCCPTTCTRGWVSLFNRRDGHPEAKHLTAGSKTVKVLFSYGVVAELW
jgi:hypothetical protein